MLLSFKDLVEFAEKRADAVNDQIFSRIGKTSGATKASGRKRSKVPTSTGIEDKVIMPAMLITSLIEEGPNYLLRSSVSISSSY